MILRLNKEKTTLETKIAAKRAIIDGVMAVLRPAPQIMNVDTDQLGFGRFRDDAMAERAVEEIGEDGADVKIHLLGCG